ncbi:2-oxoglutarate (2OG) and Fe(II)-dependent oxygenase superfamily protein [Striga asiatica]|uniref:2-oxoglutarate (2OG) and Fe(II)-dependent oxygenase superfamily protein n=1 Tax=Striga asiatica TaxID=4170 RepID=A0A5A7RG31_STRAF|nr:2-oxoglutarate (2OG) and Fe(II)-dependent oxygenase superfamily protein [Striga asiatica]
MVMPNNTKRENQITQTEPEYDRKTELKAFDDTKTGVKGLVDSGITHVPRIFIHPPQNLRHIAKKSDSDLIVPIFDLANVEKGQILNACRDWGFFQVVNHGIRESILEEMLSGVRRFHEQDDEIKRQYYTRDFEKKMIYNSNFDLYSSAAANWRDSFNCIMAPYPPDPQEFPFACRDILMEYAMHVMELGKSLFKLLSEALELKPDHLVDMDCAQTLALFGHYYPSCPQPELTLGTTKHSDYSFLTILLQDNLGGLQVLHEDQWVDVPPSPGALVVNIGDLLQATHLLVLASHLGPRTSLAAFFGRDTCDMNSRVYGPIEELSSKDNPPKYRAIKISEYTDYVRSRGLDGSSALQNFKL